MCCFRGRHSFLVFHLLMRKAVMCIKFIRHSSSFNYLVVPLLSTLRTFNFLSLSFSPSSYFPIFFDHTGIVYLVDLYSDIYGTTAFILSRFLHWGIKGTRIKQLDFCESKASCFTQSFTFQHSYITNQTNKTEDSTKFSMTKGAKETNSFYRSGSTAVLKKWLLLSRLFFLTMERRKK